MTAKLDNELLNFTTDHVLVLQDATPLGKAHLRYTHVSLQVSHEFFVGAAGIAENR